MTDQPPAETVPPIPRSFEDTPIDEMPFQGGDTVRATLRMCGVATAGDIEKLGCTGAAKHGLDASNIATLRLALSGGGVGLPCFVPITRYCLAHNTLGGLQDGQKQWYPDQVEGISRPLTAKEKGTVELIEASRRIQGQTLGERLMTTADALAGRELPKGFEAVGEDEEEVPAAQKKFTLRETGVPFEPSSWVCPEHPKLNWACRYCIAQAIVAGPYSPVYLLASGMTGASELPLDQRVNKGEQPQLTGLAMGGESVEPAIVTFDQRGDTATDVFVRVARFTRRLAREE